MSNNTFLRIADEVNICIELDKRVAALKRNIQEKQQRFDQQEKQAEKLSMHRDVSATEFLDKKYELHNLSRERMKVALEAIECELGTQQAKTGQLSQASCSNTDCLQKSLEVVTL
jgi:hypothetical protein